MSSLVPVFVVPVATISLYTSLDALKAVAGYHACGFADASMGAPLTRVVRIHSIFDVPLRKWIGGCY
jgi:hypothetical protein